MVNGQRKGAAAEREVSNIFSAEGIVCRRGQQHSAIAADGTAHPDVVFEDPSFPFHCEVKRIETSAGIFKWLEKCADEAPAGKTPVLIHKRNNTQWVAIQFLKDFIDQQTGREKLGTSNEEKK